MLSEEADSLLTRLDLNEHVVDRSSFTDEVGLSCLRGLVLAFVFVVFNDLTELIEFKFFVVLAILFFLHVLSHHVFFHFSL